MGAVAYSENEQGGQVSGFWSGVWEDLKTGTGRVFDEGAQLYLASKSLELEQEAAESKLRDDRETRVGAQTLDPRLAAAQAGFVPASVSPQMLVVLGLVALGAYLLTRD